MTDQAIEIWAEALQDVLRACLPHELRLRVLTEMLERERVEKPFRIIGIDELMAMQFADYRGKKEVLALLIQIATRTIVNNHDPPDRCSAPVPRSLRSRHRLGLALRLLGRAAGHRRRPEAMCREFELCRAEQTARSDGIDLSELI